MADSFIFSNFAVAALQEAVDEFAATLEVHPDDLVRFPNPTGGMKFPIILHDTAGNVEICYVTETTDVGSLTVQRGQEGTFAQNWLAGTQIVHGFTAGTVAAVAALTPRGPWDIDERYYIRDVVTHGNISYIAISENIGQVPNTGSVYWQLLYQPQAAASAALSWEGIWNPATNYVLGQAVRYEGRIWFSKGPSVGQIPVTGSAFWEMLAASAEHISWAGILTTTAATNNYVITAPVGVTLPTTLYDGMRLKISVVNTNTIAETTLKIGGLAPKPLRRRRGVNLAIGDLTPLAVYEFIYLAATQEFIPVESPSAPSLFLSLTDAKNQLFGAFSRMLAAAVDAADFRVKLGSTVVPIGGSIDWWDDNLPAGWLWLDGSVVSRTTYAALFAVLSTRHNTGGEAVTHFRLPDTRGRVVAGLDNMGGTAAGRLTNAGAGNSGINGTVIGAAGGVDRHAQTLAEMAVHGHSGTTSSTGTTDTVTQYGFINAASPGTGSNFVGTTNAQVTNNHNHSLNVNTAGSGQAATVVQPTIMAPKIIYAGV